MIVTVELSSEEAAVLEDRARAEGTDIQGVLRRLIASLAPPPAGEKTEPDGGQVDTAALMGAWRRDGGADDPEERAERDREREEIKANMDRWRAEQGQRPT